MYAYMLHTKANRKSAVDWMYFNSSMLMLHSGYGKLHSLCPSGFLAGLFGFWYRFCRRIVFRSKGEVCSKQQRRAEQASEVMRLKQCVCQCMCVCARACVCVCVWRTWLNVGLLCKREHRSPWRHAPILK